MGERRRQSVLRGGACILLPLAAWTVGARGTAPFGVRAGYLAREGRARAWGQDKRERDRGWESPRLLLAQRPSSNRS